MGFSHTAYLAYGLHVPVDPYGSDSEGRYPCNLVDAALADPAVKTLSPDVGHLEAGAIDEDMFFLVTACESADLGRYTGIDMAAYENRASDWNNQLMCLLVFLGWHRVYDLEPPGWFLVTDVS